MENARGTAQSPRIPLMPQTAALVAAIAVRVVVAVDMEVADVAAIIDLTRELQVTGLLRIAATTVARVHTAARDALTLTRPRL